MNVGYQAQWVSKAKAESLRRSGVLAGGVLLDSFNGFVVIEPVGSEWGDGKILSTEEADYELSPAWCLESKARVSQARRLLGLDAGQLSVA